MCGAVAADGVGFPFVGNWPTLAPTTQRKSHLDETDLTTCLRRARNKELNSGIVQATQT